MLRDLGLVLLATLFLLPGIGQTRDFRSRELRHAEIAREMAASGDFVVPTLIGRPYRDKPPVLHAAAAMLYRIGGGPSIGLARLASAIAAILAVLCTFAIGRILADRKTALLAAVSLVGVQQFALMARTARPDMYLTLGIMASCLGIAWGTTPGLPAGRRFLAALLTGAGAGLGALTKGPLGIVVPAIFAVALPWRDPRPERPRLSFLAVAFAAMLAVAAIWVVPAWLRDGGEYFRSVIFQPDLTSGGGQHARPFYWYLGPILVTALPLTFLLPAVFVHARRRGIGAALVTAIAIFVVLSAIPGKRNHYLLPLFPFLALATAAAVVDLGREKPWLKKTAWALALVALAGPGVFAWIFLPLTEPAVDQELHYAQDILAVTGPDAAIVTDGDLSQPLAWVYRRSDFGLYEDAAEADAALAAAPRPAWFVTGKREPALVDRVGSKWRLTEVEVPGGPGKERGVLYRVEGRR